MSAQTHGYNSPTLVVTREIFVNKKVDRSNLKDADKIDCIYLFIYVHIMIREGLKKKVKT